MKKLAILLVLAAAACGADGDPEPVPGGIQVGGTASIGVSGSL